MSERNSGNIEWYEFRLTDVFKKKGKRNPAAKFQNHCVKLELVLEYVVTGQNVID